MTNLVVDSNIVFSAILNVDSRIGQILITGGKYYNFYSPEYLRKEIWSHQDKIRKIAKIKDLEFTEVYELIIRNITLLNHSIVDS